MKVSFLLLILIASVAGCRSSVKDNDNNKPRFKFTQIQPKYKYVKWYELHPPKDGAIEVKIYQDSLYNLFIEVYDSSKRRVYGSAAAMMLNIDTTGPVIKNYLFNENQKMPTYVISTYVIGSTYGKATLFFIWNNGNTWQIRSDGLNRARVESLNNGRSYEIIDYYPNQEKHIYKFINGNIIPMH